MSNCTKEYTIELVNKYWEREWNKIKNIDFPKLKEYDITDQQCFNEFSNLIKNANKNNVKTTTKGSSPIVSKYHKSMIFANKNKKLSPYDYWQLLKKDENKFKKFYANRLRYSDWFNEKEGENFKYLERGFVPEFIYGIGLTTSGISPIVSYFKPKLAQSIILKYLNEFDTIFDPCSGYSGRMLGTLSTGKNYIGYDVNNWTIEESKQIYDIFCSNLPNNATLKAENSLTSTSEFDCLFTCTPYGKAEIWQDKNGKKIISNLSCDDWIDTLVNNFKCKKYIFVVDGSISKYKENIVETLTNVCHWGNNEEYIIEIQK